VNSAACSAQVSSSQHRMAANPLSTEGDSVLAGILMIGLNEGSTRLLSIEKPVPHTLFPTKRAVIGRPMRSHYVTGNWFPSGCYLLPDLTGEAGELPQCRLAVGGQPAQPAIVASGVRQIDVFLNVVPLMDRQGVAGPEGDNVRRKARLDQLGDVELLGFLSVYAPLFFCWRISRNIWFPGLSSFQYRPIELRQTAPKGLWFRSRISRNASRIHSDRIGAVRCGRPVLRPSLVSAQRSFSYPGSRFTVSQDRAKASVGRHPKPRTTTIGHQAAQ
jgi:hypothetical protein